MRNARKVDEFNDRPDEIRVRRWTRPLLLWLVGSLVLLCLGAAAFVFLLRNPGFSLHGAPASVTFRVQSRSMEPSWLGPRFEAQCPECGATVVMSIDVTSTAADVGPARGNEDSPEVQAFRKSARVLVCPSCGYDRVPAESAVFKDGELLTVSPTAEEPRAPERWRAAILRDPSGVYTLKRLVGLPGERVAIRRGDVWIDGELARRTLDELWATAAPIGPIAIAQTTDRLYATRVVKLRKPTTSGAERVDAVPTAISNESPVPSFNGGSCAAPELVRDFLTRFRWDSSMGGGSFTILARRPDAAWSVDYTAAPGRLTVRSIPLSDGKAFNGRRFEELAPDDFKDSEPTTIAVPSDVRGASISVAVAAVDGELVFAIDGEELARFDLKDAESETPAAISTPFAILGDVARASDVAVYRDLHYSSSFAGETPVPDDRYYALGDNSPASRDSRLDEVGTIPSENVLYLAPESKEAVMGTDSKEEQ